MYAVLHGRARYIPTAEVLESVASGVTPLDVDDIRDTGAVYGPALPALAGLPRTADEMRTWICRDLRGAGVEFGAELRPIEIPAAANVLYSDRLPTEQLSVKFGPEERDRLVPVDFVDDIAKMENVPDDHRDFFIASHVIQQIADPLGVLSIAAEKLRPGGRLVLVVPDQRRTFDAARSTTPLSRLVVHHLADEPSHMLESYFEMAFAVEGLGARESLEVARARMAAGEDTQLHTFTYESFRAVARLACAMFGYKEVWSQDGQLPDDSQAAEFYYVFTR